MVIGQSTADGIPLSRVELDQLPPACAAIWEEIFVNWTTTEYGDEQSTLSELLACELGDSFTADGWLREWAQAHGLLQTAFLTLPDEDGPLPNPWRLFAEDTTATQTKIHYLVGRAHGDLHADNILVPVHDTAVYAQGFRMIDLATYRNDAPLSRDLASLLVSLCWREIGASSPRSRRAFLTYLERDHPDPRLHDSMPGDVRKVIDGLRTPALQFATDRWELQHWHRQVKVSLLAQAMLHTAYTSGTPDARRWCCRLAGRLTHILLHPAGPHEEPPMPFDAGTIDGTSTTPVRNRPSGTGAVFVDRTGPRSRLRAALEDQVTSVIVVSGPPGIGKTALVREVLADLGRADPDDGACMLRWHEVTPYADIGVPTLVADVEPPGSGHAAGPTARARLEIALDKLGAAGGILPVIVLDAAEHLLTEDDVLRDTELDLAFEAIHSRRHPPVKVVFISHVVPAATTGVTWTETACRISLDGLEPPSLREHFAALAPADSTGLAALPEPELRRIHGRLAGNPRLAELLHALQCTDPPMLQPTEVAPWLSGIPAGQVHQRLVDRFVNQLPIEQQRVVQALAALGIPADTDAITGVVGPSVPAALIEPALHALVAARMVLQRRDGRRYLRRTEIEPVLSRLPAEDRRPAQVRALTRIGLLVRAAKVVATLQKEDEDVHSIADLDMHFARIDIWLRAGLYDQAFSVIAAIEDVVNLWGSGAELRTQREAVRGRLDDRLDEMVNLAALGHIYSYSGELSQAQTAYRAALAIAQQDQDREAIRQIYIGMGTMFAEHDHLLQAAEHYQWALGLASDDEHDRGDRVAALIGVADCQQRHGDYRKAVATALAAFDTAPEDEPTQAVDAGLRLTRWYAEIDQLPDALTMLSRCSDLVLARPDPWAWAELLYARAELDLYRDRYDDARTSAEQSIAVARDHRDPVNLRRSLTTFALTQIHLGNLEAARTAIEEAARYRVAGRETVELAVRAIIAHRCDLPGTARDLFQQLRAESGARIAADSNDLAAWDFAGIAECYLVLTGQRPPEAPLEAFRRARPKPAEQTPGLDDRLRFMVHTLADGNRRLELVLTQLADIRPGRTT
ncbi:hypothetical protein ADL15_07105 [Actinoplanes awajinensis subsp. mycoplanecinus]|uniref:Uncharacterized protein n=1 Tax=Actinoplanes awajinensis subsp. mycoplanecinus TaxID=135947 RepID=A0A0X3V732_9ACTN|nr:hypothetical protein ADL15_07105 [Actinoplanes awajinensis subsp. mycoplanecinus]